MTYFALNSLVSGLLLSNQRFETSPIKGLRSVLSGLITTDNHELRTTSPQLRSLSAVALNSLVSGLLLSNQRFETSPWYGFRPVRQCSTHCRHGLHTPMPSFCSFCQVWLKLASFGCSCGICKANSYVAHQQLRAKLIVLLSTLASRITQEKKFPSRKCLLLPKLSLLKLQDLRL